MGDKTAIGWTSATWNPVTGCSKVSPGCAHCYAETLTRRFAKTWGVPDLPWTPENAERNVFLHHDRLDQPLRWKRPRMVFVNSMSDLFHEEVPDSFIAHVWTTMARAQQHVFQILTKRPERMRDLVPQLALAYQCLARRLDREPPLRRPCGRAARDAGGRAVHQRGAAIGAARRALRARGRARRVWVWPDGRVSDGSDDVERSERKPEVVIQRLDNGLMVADLVPSLGVDPDHALARLRAAKDGEDAQLTIDVGPIAPRSWAEAA